MDRENTDIVFYLENMPIDKRPHLVYLHEKETGGKDTHGDLIVTKHRSATIVTPDNRCVEVDARPYTTYPHYLGTEILKIHDRMQKIELGEMIGKILFNLD